MWDFKQKTVWILYKHFKILPPSTRWYSMHASKGYPLSFGKNFNISRTVLSYSCPWTSVNRTSCSQFFSEKRVDATRFHIAWYLHISRCSVNTSNHSHCYFTNAFSLCYNYTGYEYDLLALTNSDISIKCLSF